MSKKNLNDVLMSLTNCLKMFCGCVSGALMLFWECACGVLDLL